MPTVLSSFGVAARHETLNSDPGGGADALPNVDISVLCTPLVPAI